MCSRPFSSNEEWTGTHDVLVLKKPIDKRRLVGPQDFLMAHRKGLNLTNRQRLTCEGKIIKYVHINEIPQLKKNNKREWGLNS